MRMLFNPQKIMDQRAIIAILMRKALLIFNGFKLLSAGYGKEIVIILVILMVIFGLASFFVSHTSTTARSGMINVGFLEIINLAG